MSSASDKDGVSVSGRGDGARPSALVEPDAHGQAALLLAESILHTLIEIGTINASEAIAAVVSAAEVKIEVAEAAGESKKRMRESLALLSRIANSLEIDADARGLPSAVL